MKDRHSVSCICLTYDRPQLLEEAIFAFLQQDYVGEKELIILNDHAKQTLEFDHPEVIVVNVPQRFCTEAEKRNAAVALCSHDLIFVWDVEDIYLPHRLSFSVEKFDEATGFYKLDEAFVWTDGRLSGLQKNVFHNGSCWSRDRFNQVHGYDYMIDYGYDQEIEHQFRPRNRDPANLSDTDPAKVYCIYRWQHKSHNRAMYLHRSNATAEGKMRKHIRLDPHWEFDYIQQVQDYLATSTDSHGFRNSSKTAKNIRVDFLIVGAQKSGTTALWAYLRLHPEICMAGRKEVHFFDNERIFNDEPAGHDSLKKLFQKLRRGCIGSASSVPDDLSGDKYDLYHASFLPQPPQRLCGEASPTYMYWYDAPGRIWKYNPAMKLIIILRNPIDRAYSHWNMRRVNRGERRSFRAALEYEVNTPRRKLPFQNKGLIDRGFYTEQIRRIWHYFHEEQTLILRFEELRNEPQATIDKVCDFLGVTRIEAVLAKELRSNPYPSPLSKEDRDFLKNMYKFEIKKLERLLGWDCREWLNDPET